MSNGECMGVWVAGWLLLGLVALWQNQRLPGCQGLTMGLTCRCMQPSFGRSRLSRNLSLKHVAWSTSRLTPSLRPCPVSPQRGGVQRHVVRDLRQLRHGRRNAPRVLQVRGQDRRAWPARLCHRIYEERRAAHVRAVHGAALRSLRPAGHLRHLRRWVHAPRRPVPCCQGCLGCSPSYWSRRQGASTSGTPSGRQAAGRPQAWLASNKQLRASGWSPSPACLTGCPRGFFLGTTGPCTSAARPAVLVWTSTWVSDSEPRHPQHPQHSQALQKLPASNAAG